MTSRRSAHSFAPLTVQHLIRLAALADIKHAEFTREGAHKHAWVDRRVAAVLAQGAAKHFVDGRNGIKDLDVWSFYAARPGEPMRSGRYETHADFGPSALGRQRYAADMTHPQLATWLAYEGRRIDFLVRDLPVDPDAPVDEVTEALRAWLDTGSRERGDETAKHSTPWHLSRKTMVWLAPGTPGSVIWHHSSAPVGAPA